MSLASVHLRRPDSRAGTGAKLRFPARAALILLFATAIAATACDDGNRNATDAADADADSSISVAGAEKRLRDVVLTADDVGDAFTQDVARTITNAQAAHARPDTAAAERQYAAWGQVLSYNVQFSHANVLDAVNTPAHARVMNNATIYNDADGAATAMLYLRALPVELLENILTNDGAGTRITDTHVQHITFAPHGDESYALRTSGKAIFTDRFAMSFIADTVFVRSGNINGVITAVALGAVPDRAELERLVGRFVAKAREA